MDQFEAEVELLSAGSKKKKTRSEDNARQEECQVGTRAQLGKFKWGDFQNLRTREGFCRKFKGLKRGLGRSSMKMFDFNAILSIILAIIFPQYL